MNTPAPRPDADECCEELQEGLTSYPYQVGLAVRKLNYTHDAMIDLIIANPRISNQQLADAFGYTASWVSLVKSSNAFQERLAARRTELIDPVIQATLDERFRALTTRSLEILQEKLAGPASVIPDGLALKAAELGAKALGIGGNAPPQSVPLPGDHLDRLAERLVMLQRRTVNSEVVIENEVPAQLPDRA